MHPKPQSTSNAGAREVRNHRGGRLNPATSIVEAATCNKSPCVKMMGPLMTGGAFVVAERESFLLSLFSGLMQTLL